MDAPSGPRGRRFLLQCHHHSRLAKQWKESVPAVVATDDDDAADAATTDGHDAATPAGADDDYDSTGADGPLAPHDDDDGNTTPIDDAHSPPSPVSDISTCIRHVLVAAEVIAAATFEFDVC